MLCEVLNFELFFACHLSEVLRECTSVALALGHECHPIIVGFVFEPNVDRLRNLCHEFLQWFPFVVGDVRIRRYPD